MAQMFPPTTPRRGPGSRAMLAAFEAFRELPDDFLVYQNLRVLEHEHADECEVDFLVVERVESAILNLEIKGDGLRRRRDGTWTRDTRDGTKPTEDPFAQAQRTIKTAMAEIHARMRGTFPDRPFVHGHAVGFPLVRRVDGGLPLDVQREIVLLQDDLPHLQDWLRAAFAFWRKARPAPIPLEPRDFVRFRRQILNPKFHVVETGGARLHTDAATIARLSQQQIQALKGCLASKRLRVTGAAGTGKTVLAIEAARRFAREAGRSVLVVCYTNGLAADLASACARAGAYDGEVVAVTFHELCKRAADALGKRFVPPTDDAEKKRFWDEVAPEMLFDAVTAGKLGKFDAIVVDEAQDFSGHWATVLEACLRDPEKGALVVFDDPEQGIFDRGVESGFAKMPAVFELGVNFRNARKIASVVRQLGSVDFDVHPDAPEGDEPSVHPMESEARTVKRVDELVRKLVEEKKIAPESIVVLTPHTRGRSSLKGVKTLGGIALTSSASGERAGRVLHTTIGAFKGLEADVVILVDVDADDPRCGRRARYVAASRARLMLFVFAKGEWVG